MLAAALVLAAAWFGWSSWVGIPAVGRMLYAQADFAAEPPRRQRVPDRPVPEMRPQGPVEFANALKQKREQPPGNTGGPPLLAADFYQY